MSTFTLSSGEIWSTDQLDVLIHHYLNDLHVLWNSLRRIRLYKKKMFQESFIQIHGQRIPEEYRADK